MTYRDDLEAAQARARSAEQEADELRARLAENVERDELVSRPVTISVEGTATGTRMRMNTRRPDIWGAAAIMALFDGFTILAFVQGEVSFTTMLLAAIMLAMSYWVVAQIVNKTTIDVSLDRLRVHHGPLRWYRSHDLDARRVRQVFVKTISKRGGHELCAIVDDDEHVQLVTNLSHAEAVFFEKTIENRMGIADRAVAGEAR